MQNIYILGAGAIGGLIGGYMTKRFGKQNIILIDNDKEHVETIRENRLKIKDLGNEKIKETQSIDVNIIYPQEIINSSKKLENIILSTKSYSNDETLELLSRAEKILILQNGYDEKLDEFNDAARGIEFGFACQVKEPGFIYNAVKGGYILGKLNKKIDFDSHFWNYLLNKGGIDSKLTDNLSEYMWSKILINSALNPVSAITGYSFKEIIDDSRSKQLFIDLYREGYPIVKKKAGQLRKFESSPALMNFAFKFPKIASLGLKKSAEKFGAVESSMLQDIRKGNPTEIDDINGQIIKLGRAYGIESPLNKNIYNLIKKIEQGEIKPNPENSLKIYQNQI